MQSSHEGVRYICDLCEYKSTRQNGLKRHIQAKHEGVTYKCDQCDYKASRKSDLPNHKRIKHEGVKRHIQTKHER